MESSEAKSYKQNEDLRGLWSENGNQFGQRLRQVETDFIIMQMKCLSVQIKQPNSDKVRPARQKQISLLEQQQVEELLRQ